MCNRLIIICTSYEFTILLKQLFYKSSLGHRSSYFFRTRQQYEIKRIINISMTSKMNENMYYIIREEKKEHGRNNINQNRQNIVSIISILYKQVSNSTDSFSCFATDKILQCVSTAHFLGWIRKIFSIFFFVRFNEARKDLQGTLSVPFGFSPGASLGFEPSQAKF